MAFIIKGDGITPAYHSPLAKTDFWRQKDVYILAQRGHADCRRLWADFAAEVPAMARLVVADVESERAETAKVARGVDKRLRKAEKATVTKAAKPAKLTKSEKQAIRAQRPSPEARFDAQLAAWLNSENPADREAAREALRARGVFR